MSITLINRKEKQTAAILPIQLNLINTAILNLNNNNKGLESSVLILTYIYVDVLMSSK